MEDLNKSIKQTSVLDSDIKGKEKEVVKTFEQRLDKLINLQNKAKSLFDLLNSNLISNGTKE